MYSKLTCHKLKIPCQIQNARLTARIYSSYKILPKPQMTKVDLRNQQNVDKIEFNNINNNNINNNNNNNKYLVQSLEKAATHPVLNYPIPNLRVAEEHRKGNIKWRELELDISKIGNYYLKLSKFRLTSLVVMTSMIGYAMSPCSFNLISFLSCTVGTGLVSSAANSINQFLEVPFDAQMSRTRNRVLIQGHLSPLHALGFAAGASTLGVLILYLGTNTLTATLGATNLLLYTMIYTPLKRISILNTWVGSIVGAIPPLMGWAACQGSLDAGAFILGGILYAWQFPHFNALSWNLRPDYSKAGYRMMAVTNPGLCRRTALRYTIGIVVCSSLAPVLDLTHWSFAVLSAPVNLYFVYLGFKFFKESDSKNSRKLFRYSLLHLPFLMGLMLITKKDLLSFSEDETKEKQSLVFQTNDDNSIGLIKNFIPSNEKSYSGPQVPL